MSIKFIRSVAIITFVITIIALAIDGFFVHNGQWFDGFGTFSSFILPPIGIVFAIIALNKTGSKIDILLLLLNIFAFLFLFMWMLVGTLIFGP